MLPILGLALGSRLNPGPQMVPQMDQIEATGARYTRFSFEWLQIERIIGGGYYWDGPDKLVAEHLKRGMKISLSLSGRGQDKALLDGPEIPAWVKCSVAMVERYAPMGVILQVEGINEPGNPHIFTTTSAQAYGPLQIGLYEGVKAIAPDLPVLIGGLSTGGPSHVADWLTQLYATSARGHWDAVSCHPFSFPLSPTESFKQQHLGEWAFHQIREVMNAHGDKAMPQGVTAWGAPTRLLDGRDPTGNGTCVTEQQQAQHLADAVHRLRAHTWAGPFFAFCLSDNPVNTGDPADGMGLYRTDGSRKPAFDTFHQLATGGTP